jgi:chemotaxis protein MotA
MEPEEIRGVMDVEIDNTVSYRGQCAARVYEAMGGYSPTIGIIGAVLGLIHVMNNLQRSQRARQRASPWPSWPRSTASGFANLFFLPVSNKLKAIYGDQMQFQRDGGRRHRPDRRRRESRRRSSSKLEGYLD